MQQREKRLLDRKEQCEFVGDGVLLLAGPGRRAAGRVSMRVSWSEGSREGIHVGVQDEECNSER